MNNNRCSLSKTAYQCPQEFMNRILAIALAFIIGTPYCWCCTMKDAPSGPGVHECCKMSAETGKECPLDKGTSKSKKGDDACSCDLSKTKREASSTVIALPEPAFSFAEFSAELQ